MNVHPKSGFHYIHVFPEGPFFTEIMAAHMAAGERHPWMSAVLLGEMKMTELGDPRNFIIFWQAAPEWFPMGSVKGRKAIRFTESLNLDPERVDSQKGYFLKFEESASKFDFVIAHTPTAVDILKKRAENVILLPIGYEPLAYGTPDWEAEKEIEVIFYGSIAGKRRAVLDALDRKMGGRITIFSGYWKERKKALDTAKISLYVGHCEDPSFGTSRLWQTIASSAVLATEERDAWPAAPSRHYIPLPKADPENMDEFVEVLEEVLGRDDLLEISKAAHEDLSKFTVGECAEKYLVRQTAGAL